MVEDHNLLYIMLGSLKHMLDQVRTAASAGAYFCYCIAIFGATMNPQIPSVNIALTWIYMYHVIA